MRAARAARKRRFDSVYLMLEVNVILFCVETTLFTCIKLGFFYSLSLYIKI